MLKKCSCGQWIAWNDHCPTCAMLSHAPASNHKLERMTPHRIIEHALNCADLSSAEHDRLESMSFYHADNMVEPGYSTCHRWYTLGNYNPPSGWSSVPGKNKMESRTSDSFTRAIDALERVSECYWDDEWITCSECNGLMRTSSNGYDWTQYFHHFDGCADICFDCLDHAEYLEDIQDNPRTCVLPGLDLDPCDHGFEPYNGQYETGWHPGQNDNPDEIAKHVMSLGYAHYVFALDDVGQFDAHYRIYVKGKE